MNLFERAESLSDLDVVRWQTREEEWNMNVHKELVGDNELPLIPSKNERLNRIIAASKVRIFHGPTESPQTRLADSVENVHIVMPHPAAAMTGDEYDSSLAHELAHATKPLFKRLENPSAFEVFGEMFGLPAPSRSAEELVAQLSAYKLMNAIGAGSEYIERYTTYYLRLWMGRIEEAFADFGGPSRIWEGEELQLPFYDKAAVIDFVEKESDKVVEYLLSLEEV